MQHNNNNIPGDVCVLHLDKIMDDDRETFATAIVGFLADCSNVLEQRGTCTVKFLKEDRGLVTKDLFEVGEALGTHFQNIIQDLDEDLKVIDEHMDALPKEQPVAKPPPLQLMIDQITQIEDIQEFVQYCEDLVDDTIMHIMGEEEEEEEEDDDDDDDEEEEEIPLEPPAKRARVLPQRHVTYALPVKQESAAPPKPAGKSSFWDTPGGWIKFPMQDLVKQEEVKVEEPKGAPTPSEVIAQQQADQEFVNQSL